MRIYSGRDSSTLNSSRSITVLCDLKWYMLHSLTSAHVHAVITQCTVHHNCDVTMSASYADVLLYWSLFDSSRSL
eukprot:4634-Heterococcus_DN1.PRE.2